jgi:chaperonin cofactor prefoldin
MDERATAEQNLQHLTVQKQALQQQLVELDLAAKELVDAQRAYRVVGGLLIAADVPVLRADLTRKKESAEQRLATLEKHEARLRAKLHDGHNH